ncbi:amino acid ABC transporter substrate-binding protein [Sedimentitalea todarodis]|uniref:Amino acid ABC transporter substrate-binding protein n=1 Tax=Sedimentitalea todarodis TaxID=1631240 RepID=A0ABU3VFM9_9RHOB|nr:amino acid ABC transporter substrate-binding protein [Sedimentitalea todarodis]MDU9004986.1 amino acid ABC transporter substrate-binding protein [Sedimentitalea todarodis]
MRHTLPSLFATALLAFPVGAQTLDRILETGEMKLGYRTDAAPLSYQNEEGNPAGYTPLICINVAQAIANALQLENLDVSFVPVSTEDRFDKVASGEIDLLCGAATITLARREIVDFSDPVYVDGTSILLPNGAQGSLEDLAGKKIGVRGATTTEEALNTSLLAAGLTADVVPFESHAEGISAMEDKEIVAYFADQSILMGLFRSSPKANEMMISNEILTIEKQGLAMVRGDADFRLLVDTVVSELFNSGKMREFFAAAMPGAEPGAALEAMYLLSPTAR